MNFLQYAVWGAWLISLGGYLGGHLHFDGLQIGSFYAIMGLVSLITPALMGIVADKWINAEKVLSICHILAAAFMVMAAQFSDYVHLYAFMLLSVAFYMPTISLTNVVAYSALEKNGYNTVKDFPPIRIFGTVGFIIAMWIVDLNGFKDSAAQLYFSAAIGFILGLYAITLPKVELKKVEKQSLIDTLGLRAFSLFKDKKMAIFFIFSMLLGMSLQVTNGFADDYLRSYFGKIPEYINTFGVQHSVMLISLSQISETLCILLIPFFLRWYGIKNVMLISMFAWVFRFGLLGVGNPGSGVWMLVLSMIVYGVAFDFFNISGSLYVNEQTNHNPSIKASAQGVFMMMTNGFGAFIGSYTAGWVVKTMHASDSWIDFLKYPKLATTGMTNFPAGPNAWLVFAAFALVVAIAFIFIFRYKHSRNNS
jgi:NHS family xanthosine MFS transporter